MSDIRPHEGFKYIQSKLPGGIEGGLLQNVIDEFLRFPGRDLYTFWRVDRKCPQDTMRHLFS